MATLLKIIGPRGEWLSTLNDLRGRVANAGDYADALDRLLESREATVELKNGETATIVFADESSPPLPPRRALFVPRHDYEAVVKLRLQLNAHIECSASSRQEAGYLIDRVLRRREKAPGGFRMFMDAQDVEVLARQLDASERVGGTVDVVDYDLVTLRERLMITSQEIRS